MLAVEVLRRLAPRMIENEQSVNFLAYKPIRLLIVQAALETDVHPRQLSVKNSVRPRLELTAYRVDAAFSLAEMAAGRSSRTST